MNKILLNKIPYLFKNVPLPRDVEISEYIPAIEGAILLVKAKSHLGKKNDFDFANGRQGFIWENDIFPAVVGFRKAVVEFAGIVPDKIDSGDILYLLCESGLVGGISGIFPSWGTPMEVEVLGSIVGKDKQPMNLKNYMHSAICSMKKKAYEERAPLVLFLGTIMDAGKTTMACKMIHQMKSEGKKVVAIKVTGVSFSQDLMKLLDAGADAVYDFVDAGLPSTCNDSPKEVVTATNILIQVAQQHNPDCIIVELGDGVLGEYHVADILSNSAFVSQIGAIVLAAKDLAGIKGTQDILKELSLSIDLITGPIANSEAGIHLIDKYFSLPADSNQKSVEIGYQIIAKKIFRREVNYEKHQTFL